MQENEIRQFKRDCDGQRKLGKKADFFKAAEKRKLEQETDKALIKEMKLEEKMSKVLQNKDECAK